MIHLFPDRRAVNTRLILPRNPSGEGGALSGEEAVESLASEQQGSGRVLDGFTDPCSEGRAAVTKLSAPASSNAKEHSPQTGLPSVVGSVGLVSLSVWLQGDAVAQRLA